MTWTVDEAAALAARIMPPLGARWQHTQGVAKAVDTLTDEPACLMAAWLHDIGYAPRVGSTGMHAIDGARHLDLLEAPKEVVSLVAFHTGAEFEAEERGLTDALFEFEDPDQDDLDLLTLADLTTGPSGEAMQVQQRLDEILQRYEPQHPVHRAVTRSREYLFECCERAAKKYGYPM